MITNPKGWRNKRAAALIRRQEKSNRAAINAARWRAFEGLPPEEELDIGEVTANDLASLEAQMKLEQISSAIASTTQDLSNAIEGAIEEAEVDPETLDNKSLREALEGAGFEVPKTTARARLIELYKEKVK
jgi:hypothetical protein